MSEMMLKICVAWHYRNLSYRGLTKDAFPTKHPQQPNQKTASFMERMPISASSSIVQRLVFSSTSSLNQKSSSRQGSCGLAVNQGTFNLTSGNLCASRCPAYKEQGQVEGPWEKSSVYVSKTLIALSFFHASLYNVQFHYVEDWHKQVRPRCESSKQWLRSFASAHVVAKA